MIVDPNYTDEMIVDPNYIDGMIVDPNYTNRMIDGLIVHFELLDLDQ